jgi:hypothetical protein
MKKEEREKREVEKELSMLFETTLRLEDELNHLTLAED